MKSTRLAAFGVVAALVGCGGPQNYDQCILESFKEGMNEATVDALTSACYNEFPPPPEPEPEKVALTYSELSRLTGRGGGSSYGTTFSGNLYNGTSHHLSEVTFEITTTSNGNAVTRSYTDDVSIAPQTSGPFRFDYIVGDRDGDTGWSISGAKYTK